MRFEEALTKMQQGKKMKLPSWGGYWCWDKEKETIMIHCREKDSDTGKDVLDIRETQRVAYTSLNIASNEWEEATEENCTLLGGEPTFNFKIALRYMERGINVKRKCKPNRMFTKNSIFKTEDIKAKDWTFAS